MGIKDAAAPDDPLNQLSKSKPAVKSDLLSPKEAWRECKNRMSAVIPDLPALILVIIFGGLGAWIAGISKFKISDSSLTDKMYENPILLIVFGIIGAVTAVFLLAKTDTSKLIHCSLIALFSGMAGPSFVVKGIKTVTNSDVSEANIAQVVSVAKQATKHGDAVANGIESDGAHADKFLQQVDDTSQSITSYLKTVNDITKNNPEEKGQLLSKTQQPIQEALNNLNKAMDTSPTKILPLVEKIAATAKEVGAESIGAQAQQILDSNANSSRPELQPGNVASRNDTFLYFITPSELTDQMLKPLQSEIEGKFPSFKFQPAVHPKNMDDGIEVVYYQVSDKSAAEQLQNITKKWAKVNAGQIRLAQRGSGGPQFDVHIGPNIARKISQGQ